MKYAVVSLIINKKLCRKMLKLNHITNLLSI